MITAPPDTCTMRSARTSAQQNLRAGNGFDSERPARVGQRQNISTVQLHLMGPSIVLRPARPSGWFADLIHPLHCS
jgi:hypothetical protein